MEPTSTLLPVLAVLASAALLWTVIRCARWWARAGAGAGLIVVGVLLGLVAVNDYYGYYQSWTELGDDFGSGPSLAVAAAATGVVGHLHGSLQSVQLTGSASGISRSAIVYLPPQYDEPAYAHERFPVIELMSGSPGTPANWVVQLRIARVANDLIDDHAMGPAVLVMPSINGGRNYEECLNANGTDDETYLTDDVRAFMVRHFRVASDPQQWGIGGYSSGGYCSANLALTNPALFGAAFTMDGYFDPADGPAGDVLHHDPAAEAANNPLDLVSTLGPGASVPAFWVAAGTAGAGDYAQSLSLVHRLAGIEQVPFMVEPHARHNFYAWSAVLPRALSWCWQDIATPDLRHLFPVAGSPTRVQIPPFYPHLQRLEHRALKMLAGQK